MKKLIIPIVVVSLLLLGFLFHSQRADNDLKVSGFVEADDIRLGSRIGGRIEKVLVDEGDQVRAGQLLVQLEPFDLQERLDQARGVLQQREAEFAKLKTGFRPEEIAQARARRDQIHAQLDLLIAGPRAEDIAAAEAQLELARAEFRLAQADYQRSVDLSKQGAISRQDLDRATSTLRVAQETVNAREEELRKLKRGSRDEEIAEARARLAEAEAALKLADSGFRTEEVQQAQAGVAAARAEVAAIERQLAELRILAPSDGLIEAVELEPGDIIAPNAPVLSMIDLNHLYVRAYVPENRLSLSVGKPVTIGVDSFPGWKFKGRISFIARQAEFTPGNVQTPEERSKQVFRIKVEIEEGREKLRPGMAADVWLGSPDE